MREIAALADVPTIFICSKSIDVSEEPSAVATMSQTMINTMDTTETAADANTKSINIASCSEGELANTSQLVMTSY